MIFLILVSDKLERQIRKNKTKKGFTLVELLAVIIILAIVVGITIPAVLTTTENAKKRAFQTAADSAATWVDRQYEIYKMGLSSSGLLTLDPIFEQTCIRTCYVAEKCLGSQFNDSLDYFETHDDGKCNCNCDHRVTFLTQSFVESAGIKPQNISFKSGSVTNYNGYNGIRVRHNDTYYMMQRYYNGNDYKLSLTSNTYKNIANWTKVYINPETGKSCITLHSSNDGDYPKNKTACGGSCQSSVTTSPDYCKSTY